MPRFFRPDRLDRRAAGLLLALAVSIAGPMGCGYSVRAPYDTTIQTVYVPIFRSFSFREDMNFLLTEEVIKEIERRTPYRVVDTQEEADSILSGNIQYATKYELVVSPFNLPRQLAGELKAEVTWEDIRPGADRDVAPPTIQVVENIYFYPELGETSTLGYEKAIRKMAKDIVNMMEERW